MFVDEDQWARAFMAAKNVVDALYADGEIDVPTGHKVNGTLHRAAVSIATAALRAAAQDDEGDISTVAGVRVDNVGSPPAAPATLDGTAGTVPA